jgi:hypothetical protein
MGITQRLAPATTARAVPTPWLQEDHDFAHGLLLGPGGKDAGSANRPDADDLAQPVWRRLDNVEPFSPKARMSFLA